MNDSITQKIAKKFTARFDAQRVTKALASCESYERRCATDPVGMGIMKDNGDGTLSFIRPKEY